MKYIIYFHVPNHLNGMPEPRIQSKSANFGHSLCLGSTVCSTENGEWRNSVQLSIQHSVQLWFIVSASCVHTCRSMKRSEGAWTTTFAVSQRLGLWAVWAVVLSHLFIYFFKDNFGMLFWFPVDEDSRIGDVDVCFSSGSIAARAGRANSFGARPIWMTSNRMGVVSRC